MKYITYRIVYIAYCNIQERSSCHYPILTEIGKPKPPILYTHIESKTLLDLTKAKLQNYKDQQT